MKEDQVLTVSKLERAVSMALYRVLSEIQKDCAIKGADDEALRMVIHPTKDEEDVVVNALAKGLILANEMCFGSRKDTLPSDVFIRRIRAEAMKDMNARRQNPLSALIVRPSGMRI